MPINQQNLDIPDLCSVNVWQLNNQDLLARITASVVVGYFSHVDSLLNGRNPREVIISLAAKQKAIQYLTVNAGGMRWHRDGWIFQIISWITAKKFLNGYIGNPPHPKPANHGLDGFWVLSEPAGTVSHLIICEDKATQNPRATIRDQVWPEFLSHESGEKDAIVISNLQSLLTTNHFQNVEEIVSGIMLRDLKRYRVSITTADGLQQADLRQLFEGYDQNVAGNINKRHAEVFPLQDLRTWMDQFSENVVRIISGFNHYV